MSECLHLKILTPICKNESWMPGCDLWKRIKMALPLELFFCRGRE